MIVVALLKWDPLSRMCKLSASFLRELLLRLQDRFCNKQQQQSQEGTDKLQLVIGEFSQVLISIRQTTVNSMPMVYVHA